MNTQTIGIDKIKTNPDNPRTISDEKLQQLVNSIQAFPEMLNIRPIMIDENMMALGGNMRMNFASTVIDFDRPSISERHPTMKPVGLVQKLIENSSKPNWLVLDAFGGAGSTLIACVNSNRRCNLMELDPKFVDVIVCRWQDYTGERASNLTRNIEID
jgi:DNA modification methylase